MLSLLDSPATLTGWLFELLVMADNPPAATEFIGDVVRHTKGGVVVCDADPDDPTAVAFGPHNCLSKLTAGDEIIVWYVRNQQRGDEEWSQQGRFCPNCKDARQLPGQARTGGVEYVVVEGELEHFEGRVNQHVYDDAVRLNNVNVHAYNPPN